MKLGVAGGVIVVILAVLLFLGYSSVFTVSPTQQALVLRLGNPQQPRTEPGLHFKMPIVDTVVYIDKRILDLEAPAQEVIASDQKRLVVDAFARYRIKMPLRYYQTLGSSLAANSQLAIILNSALRRVLGEATFTHVVRDERAGLMNRIRELVDKEAGNYGIEVVDVRIRRADLPEANSQAVYRRMQTEREREAKENRAQGAEIAERIKADAERQRTIILAEAQRQSEILRGDGEAERARIFAEAAGQDPEFYAFYRSLQAYRQALQGGSTSMVLTPDSEFFKFFNNAGGGPSGTPQAAR